MSPQAGAPQVRRSHSSMDHSRPGPARRPSPEPARRRLGAHTVSRCSTPAAARSDARRSSDIPSRDGTWCREPSACASRSPCGRSCTGTCRQQTSGTLADPVADRAAMLLRHRVADLVATSADTLLGYRVTNFVADRAAVLLGHRVANLVATSAYALFRHRVANPVALRATMLLGHRVADAVANGAHPLFRHRVADAVATGVNSLLRHAMTHVVTHRSRAALRHAAAHGVRDRLATGLAFVANTRDLLFAAPQAPRHDGSSGSAARGSKRSCSRPECTCSSKCRGPSTRNRGSARPGESSGRVALRRPCPSVPN